MPKVFFRWLRRLLLLLGCLAVVILGLAWWMSRATPRDQRSFFNALYRRPMGAFSAAPNRLLAETVSSLRPGRALDVAMGQGRNAIFLAGKGWDVTGFDISEEALRQAATGAAEAGVRLQLVEASSEKFDYGRDQWDLIVFSYAFAPVEDADYMKRVRESLKPGGVVVFEHYTRGRIGLRIPGAPKSGELPRLFAGLEIRRYEETRANGDWQFGRKAALVRLVAVRPR